MLVPKLETWALQPDPPYWLPHRASSLQPFVAPEKWGIFAGDGILVGPEHSREAWDDPNLCAEILRAVVLFWRGSKGDLSSVPLLSEPPGALSEGFGQKEGEGPSGIRGHSDPVWTAHGAPQRMWHLTVATQGAVNV